MRRRAFYEAIVLVVLVALIGFWDWRAAMLMAASIPLTLAMTFGIVHVLGIDIQESPSGASVDTGKLPLGETAHP